MGSCNPVAVGPETEKRLAELLTASYYAASGAELAREAGDMPAVKRLKHKSELLYRRALAIDPAQNAEAWKD